MLRIYKKYIKNIPQHLKNIPQQIQNFHIHTLHIDIIISFLPTDAQVNCLKNSFKIYIKIDIKTAPTTFGAVALSSRSALLVLAKVTVVKMAN